MIKLVDLEEYVDYVVKVVRRDDKIFYGKIVKKYPDEPCPFLLDFGKGGGVLYDRWGRATGLKADGLDIIWIKKIDKDSE